MHRLLLLLPLLAVGCTDKPYVLDTGDLVDTGVPQCGRVRGTESILLYQDNGNTIRSPIETPNEYEITTGVAGPLGDDRTYVALVNGRALQTVDGGCNWEEGGSVPSGDWKLLGAGARVYAFDTLTSSGARSDDFGLTWTAFDAVEAFVGGLPVIDAADPARLRGLQSRGVVTSSDGGETWSVGATLPLDASSLADADLSPGNLDIAVLGAATGSWYSNNAGVSWTPIGPDAVSAIAVHPDDAAVLFATTTNAEDGITTVSRSADSGASWARLVDSSQVSLPALPALWPVPGNPLQALTAFGPVFNENTESDGVNLYVVTGGTGTRTVFVGTWFHINQITFGGDRWVAAVDAVR
ncbi:MAG: sialidase family protein [Pseudomonadota bacterium]|nr:sialidase family protein [Pseudomonadota bacterium]